jgi:hypothetical protein
LHGALYALGRKPIQVTTRATRRRILPPALQQTPIGQPAQDRDSVPGARPVSRTRA